MTNVLLGCILVTMGAQIGVVVRTLLTPEELKEVRHHVIDRNTSVAKWATIAIREKLKQEKESTNATVK